MHRDIHKLYDFLNYFNTIKTTTMVKPITFLAVMLAGMTANAQTWKLTDMSQETFAAGGDAQWSFEKFNLNPLAELI